MRGRIFVALMALSISVLAACHRQADIRLKCISFAHKTVKVPESDSSNRESMVREVYLRCLDRYGVTDEPPRAGNSEAP